MIAIYLAYFAGISLALFIGAVLILRIIGAFKSDPSEPFDMKFMRGAFLRRNGWLLLASFFAVFTFSLSVFTTPIPDVRFNSLAEVVGFDSLVMCGATLWTLLYDVINRLGDHLEIWVGAFGSRLKKRVQQ